MSGIHLPTEGDLRYQEAKAAGFTPAPVRIDRTPEFTARINSFAPHFTTQADAIKANSEISKDGRSASLARTFGELETTSASLSHIAHVFGDDETAAFMQNLKMGFSDLAIGFAGLSSTGAAAGAGTAASAGSMGAMSAACPYIAIAAGALVLADAFGLFGKKKKDNGLARAFEALFMALQQIGKMIEQVLKNQEQMFGMMQYQLFEIKALKGRVKLNQQQLLSYLRFMAEKPLQDKLHLLQQDLSGTASVVMTKENKRIAFQELDVWLRRHLMDPSMNHLSSSSADTSAEIAVEIMREYAHSPWMMVGFVASELRSRLGSIVPAEFLNLPPLPLYMCAARTYLLSRLRAMDIASPDGCESLCDAMTAQMEKYQDFCDLLKTNTDIWVALFAQHNHHRNRVGRAIQAISLKNSDATLDAQRPCNAKGMFLDQALDDLEATRLLLFTIAQYVDLDPRSTLLTCIMALESKHEILNLTGKVLCARRGSDLSGPIKRKSKQELDFALKAGSALEPADDLCGPLHRMAYVVGGCLDGHETRTDVFADLMNTLAVHSGRSPLEGPMLSGLNAYGRMYDGYGWWKKNILMCITLPVGLYGIALLQLAMGLAPNWLEVQAQGPGHDGGAAAKYLSNLPVYAFTHEMNANGFRGEAMMVISSTIEPTGKLYAKHLRKAYLYYHYVSTGQLGRAEMLTHEGVDPYCLLWLVSILGNWSIFERLNKTAGFAGFGDTVGRFEFFREEKFSFSGAQGGALYTSQLKRTGPAAYFVRDSATTPLMVAAEHGRRDVVEGLLRLHLAGEDIGLGKKWGDGSSAATRALQRGFVDIAQRLYDLGAPLSAEDQAKLPAVPFVGALPIAVRDEVTAVATLAARTELSQTEEHLQAMTGMIAVAKERLASLPREEVDPALAASEAKVTRLEAMLEQLLAAQGLAPPPAAPAFAFRATAPRGGVAESKAEP